MSTTLTPTDPTPPPVLTAADPAVATPPPAATAEEPSYRRRLFTAAEYWQMEERGFFTRRQTQLIGGEIVEMSPQTNLHAAAIVLTARALEAVFGAGYWVRNQCSLDLSPSSVPDPDVAVVRGDVRSYGTQRTNPTTALLIVEVSLTTLADDRTVKASLYAAAGIADYWIVNLQDNVLEVRRDPRPDATQPFGHGYSSLATLAAGESAVPLAAPAARVAVADLLPA